jgi:hypothetical protein
MYKIAAFPATHEVEKIIPGVIISIKFFIIYVPIKQQ